MRAGGAVMIDELPIFPRPEGPPARATHYLQPGFLHIAEDTTISTILGSCVAVCVWDAARRVGGMNHFLLPRGTMTAGSEGRFGETAVPRLIDELLQAGTRRGSLQAKIFGGSCITAAPDRHDHLGLKNVNVALEILDRAGIAVVATDVGGARGRKLLFHTGEGTALVRYL